jgi:PPOX class probable FMN-dependent enzyme
MDSLYSDILPPWRSPIVRALHRNRSQPQSQYIQLATRDDLGWVRNRTVVFRGWLNPGSQLKFVTDRRSAKMASLKEFPQAEACWYFTKTREQFRIAGMLRLEMVAEYRRQAWQELSDKARQSFAWPTPGKVRSSDVAFLPSEELDLFNPPDTFGLLILTPIEVDRLELRGNPQNRWRYQLEAGNWTIEEINP